MTSLYLELKAFHIVSVVAWFAGLFYIFRLFVYHRQNFKNADICKMLSLMERRLLYMIIFPATVTTILSGAALLASMTPFLNQKWLWAKLVLVCFLLLYQLFTWITFRRFRKNDFFISERACRYINEAPTFILFGIVFLVVLKPWSF